MYLKLENKPSWEVPSSPYGYEIPIGLKTLYRMRHGSSNKTAPSRNCLFRSSPKRTEIRTIPTLLILNLFSECNLQVTLRLITKPTSNFSDFISVQFFSDFLSSVLHVFLAEVLRRDHNWTNSPRCCSTRVSSLYNTV